MMKPYSSNSNAGIFRSLTTAAFLACMAFAMNANSAGTGIVPSQSKAFGRSLAQWQEIYWRWAFGDLNLPTDDNGNTVVGSVVLMPTPNVPGDGTPGSIDVAMNDGQPFVLPLWNVLGTSYVDGREDEANNLSVVQTLDITVQIDGITVVDSDNVMGHYTEFSFDPEIPLPSEWSPYQSIIWLQGIGMVHRPLSVGKGGNHIITLDVKNNEPVIDALGFEYFFEYHNTWNITVLEDE